MLIKLPIQLDINELKTYLASVQKSCAPFIKNDSPWGGWSVTSSNGEIYDGWQSGEKLFRDNISDEEKIKLHLELRDKKFDTPTSLYSPLIDKILSQLAPFDLKTTRIRLVILKPHDQQLAYWHQDGKSAANYFKLRLHIPIITNELCRFEYRDQSFHLPADGSAYIIDVSKEHRVLNESNEDRYHLMMDLLSY